MSRALYRTVKDTDGVLIYMVEDIGSEILPQGVASLSAEREKRAAAEAALTPEQREERRQANIRNAEAARKAAEARRAQFKAARKQHAAAKCEKKPNGKKAKHGKEEGQERKRA